MNNWLETYKYRININPGLFVVAGIATFALTLIVVSLNTIKAATSNPVKILGTE